MTKRQDRTSRAANGTVRQCTEDILAGLTLGSKLSSSDCCCCWHTSCTSAEAWAKLCFVRVQQRQKLKQQQLQWTAKEQYEDQDMSVLAEQKQSAWYNSALNAVVIGRDTAPSAPRAETVAKLNKLG
ncbi:hypothetical protein TYRP_010562 [Tyrophagus putrescentiae]|nr:hypothetical protein TYRP_010562 [Tyrophagus putrescentiae]